MTSSTQLETKNQFGQQIHQYTPGSNVNSTSITSEFYSMCDSMEQFQSKQPSRRVLSLKERIAVIQLAEAGPKRNTKALAEKFECGCTQIRSILLQKEYLLKEWANNGDPDRMRRRPSPIAFTISKVMEEWYFRCICSQIAPTDKEIVQKANEAKRLFQYIDFRPNKRWLDRFKKKFRAKYNGIQLNENPAASQDGKKRSLELKDIYDNIKDSLKMNVRNADMSPSQEKKRHTEDIYLESSMNYDQTMSSSNNDVCEVEISDSDHDQSYTADNFCEAQFLSEEQPTDCEEENGTIMNDEQALECLKKLEEYSMLKDDFRAIGLIVQLEKIYKGQLES